MRAFQLMAEKQYVEAEKLLASNMSKSDDDADVALYHSTLGVLYKMKGEYKTAWRHYQRAEKLLPDDPALKLISAQLLIDQFAEYDQAIRKAKKALQLIPDNPAFTHQAHSTIGLAYAKQGQRKKALQELERSIVDDFKLFITPKNINLKLVEAVLKKGWGEDICREFLRKALSFATESKDEHYIDLFTRLNAAFDAEYPSSQPETKGDDADTDIKIEYEENQK